MEGELKSKKKLGRPQSKELMIERHKQMLELQKEIFPFTPTLRELESVWYSKNTGNLVSSARSMLLNMKQEGLVVTRQKNGKTYYYAVEINTGEKNNEQLD